MHGSKNHDIEALRSVAITITLFAHLDTLVPEWSAWTGYFWLGGGVDLFFCLSGYLITSSLLRSREQSDNTKNWICAFFIRRSFRLWPAAAFWSTLTVLAAAVFNVNSSLGPFAEVLSSWAFGLLNVANIHIFLCTNSVEPCKANALWHYWSLSLEEQFYLLLPIVLLVVKSKRALIVVFLFTAIWQATTIRPWGQLLWFIRSDALLYGASIALVWSIWAERITSLPIWSLRPPVIVALSASLIALVLLSRPAWSPWYMGLVSGAAAVAVFLAAPNRDYMTKNEAVRRFTGYVGSRSYSIYLVHLPIFALARDLALSFSTPTTAEWVVMAFVATAVSVACADFSYRYVETPLRNYGSRIARSWRSTRIPTAVSG